MALVETSLMRMLLNPMNPMHLPRMERLPVGQDPTQPFLLLWRYLLTHEGKEGPRVGSALSADNVRLYFYDPKDNELNALPFSLYISATYHNHPSNQGRARL